MKFVLDGLTLSEAVTKVAKACAIRTTTPILECIKIVAGNDVVSFTATDGELTISETVTAEVFTEGEACVPGKLFSDFLSKLSGVEVTITTGGERGMEIGYNGCSSYMQVLPVENFPAIDFEIGENYFVLSEQALKNIISETVFCCAVDDSRPVLKGCLMEVKENLQITALDGYRLALSEAEIKEKSGEMSIICPARTLNEISRMLNSEGDITLYTKKGMVMVKKGGTIIVSKLYQGDFIRKENVLSSSFSTTVVVDRSELIRSVERAAILIRGDKNNLITMEIKPGTVKVTSVSEFGNVAEVMEGEVSGKELTISMNAKFILDALSALKEEKTVLSFNEAVRPFILQDEEKKASLYLILPVRNVA